MNCRGAVFSSLTVSAAIVAPRSGQSAALPTVVVYRSPGSGDPYDVLLLKAKTGPTVYSSH